MAALGESVLPVLLEWLALPRDDVRFELAGRLIRSFGATALPAVQALLRSEHASLRQVAIEVLRPTSPSPYDWRFDPEGPQIVRAVLGMLEDPDVDVRKAALALLAYGPSTGVPVAEAIGARLSSDDPDERDAACEALEQMDVDAAPAGKALAEYLARSEGDERDAAFAALWKLWGGAPDAVPVLLAEIRDHPSDASDVVGVMECWGEGARGAVPELVQLLGAQDEATAVAALEVLRGVPGAVEEHWRRVCALAVGPESDLTSTAQAALLTLVAESPGAAARIADALESMPPREAEHLLVYVQVSDAPGLEATAVALLTSADAGLRAAALGALVDTAQIVDAAPVRASLDDPDEAVRAAAASFLLDRDPVSRDRAVATVRALSESASAAGPWVVRAICRVSDPAAPGPELLRFLGSEDAEVRSEVEKFLARSETPVRDVPPGTLDAVAGDVLREGADREAATRTLLRLAGGDAVLVRTCDAAFSDLSQVPAVLDALEIAGSRAAAVLPTVERGWRRESDGAQLRRVLALLKGDVDGLAQAVDDVEDARHLLSLGDAGAVALVRAAAKWGAWFAGDLAEGLAGDAALERAILGAESSRELRIGASRLAPALEPQRAMSLLALAAANGDTAERQAAAQTLDDQARRGRDLGSADTLRRLLRDADVDVRFHACRAAGNVPDVTGELRERLDDADNGVRITAAGEFLRRDAEDASARRAFFDALAALDDDDDHWIWWDDVREGMSAMPLSPEDVPVLSSALVTLGGCDAHIAILRALARLGPAAAPALKGVRLALASELRGCDCHRPDRAEAIATLAAMGAAAAPALPDLRSIVRIDPDVADAARAAIARIEGAR